MENIKRVYLGLEWLQFFCFSNGAPFFVRRSTGVTHFGNHSCTGLHDRVYGKLTLRKLNKGVKIRCADCGFAVPVDLGDKDSGDLLVSDICLSLNRPVTSICGECWDSSRKSCSCEGTGIQADQPITYITKLPEASRTLVLGHRTLEKELEGLESPFVAITVFPGGMPPEISDISHFREFDLSEQFEVTRFSEMENFFRNFISNAIILGDRSQLKDLFPTLLGAV